MESNKRNNNSSENELQQEQNQTLHQPGAAVADYGNVTGGSANDSSKEEGVNEERSGNKSSDTLGNP